MNEEKLANFRKEAIIARFLNSAPVEFHDEMRSRMRSMHLLFQRLQDLSLTVEPTEAHLAVCGQRFRELLLLTATNFESLARLLLGKKKNFNIHDLYESREEHRFHLFQAEFREFPKMGWIDPFSSWAPDLDVVYRPLAWYQGYNATKHDGYSGLNQATLGACFNAYAGCLALINAIYGIPIVEIALKDEGLNPFYALNGHSFSSLDPKCFRWHDF